MNKNLKANVKRHIPKDWLCELRILYRLGQETLGDIIRRWHLWEVVGS